MNSNTKKLVTEYLTYDRHIDKSYTQIVDIVSNFEKDIAQIQSYLVSDVYKSDVEKMIIHAKEKEILNDDNGRAYFPKNSKTEKFDMMGLYIFYRDDKAVYVGRSKAMITRLNQHVSLGSHNTSSFALA